LNKYLICTKEQYEKGVTDGVKLTQPVSFHVPIFSPDGNEVLVKGIGDMDIEDVLSYIKANWIYPEEQL